MPPAKVFKFLIDSSGAIALLVYLVIAVSQLRMRKILQAQGGEIRLRMWLYPYLTWLVIAFITFVLVVMLFRPAQQLEVISTGLLALGNYLYGTDYVTLEKAGIVAKNCRCKIRVNSVPGARREEYSGVRT